MILKAFREKSNQKYLNDLLTKRLGSSHTSKVESIGVVLHAKEFNDSEAFISFFKELGLDSPKHSILFYVDEVSNEQAQWERQFSKKDFGWAGKLKNSDLKLFIEEPFDMLIAYYNEDMPELHQVVGRSQAKFKIGIHHHDQRLFDFILDVAVIRFDLFKQEVQKYLKILNKI